MTIGLLIMLALVSFVTGTSHSTSALHQAARMMENARYATGVLLDEVNHAGFYGELSDLPAVPGALPDPCATDPASLEAALALPIQGYDAPGGNVLSCLPDSEHVDGTDVLVLRRVARQPSAAGSLTGNAIYLQSNLSDRVVDRGDSGSFTLVNEAGPAPIYRHRVDIYYVSPCHRQDGGSCTASADDGDPLPTLCRLRLSDGPAFSRECLAEGVQNLQIDYGIDRNADGAPDETVPGTSNDAYVTLPADVAQWSDVMTLRLHLLARATQPAVGFEDQKSYVLGQAGAVGSFNDGYRRRVFSVAARAENPSGRREAP